jgi:hypothetical protein
VKYVIAVLVEFIFLLLLTIFSHISGFTGSIHIAENFGGRVLLGRLWVIDFLRGDRLGCIGIEGLLGRCQSMSLLQVIRGTALRAFMQMHEVFGALQSGLSVFAHGHSERIRGEGLSYPLLKHPYFSLRVRATITLMMKPDPLLRFTVPQKSTPILLTHNFLWSGTHFNDLRLHSRQTLLLC